MYGPSSGRRCELDKGWEPTGAVDDLYYGKTQVFERAMVEIFAGRLMRGELPESEPDTLSPANARRHALALACAERICAHECPLFQVAHDTQDNSRYIIVPRVTDYPPLRSV